MTRRHIQSLLETVLGHHGNSNGCAPKWGHQLAQLPPTNEMLSKVYHKVITTKYRYSAPEEQNVGTLAIFTIWPKPLLTIIKPRGPWCRQTTVAHRRRLWHWTFLPPVWPDPLLERRKRCRYVCPMSTVSRRVDIFESFLVSRKPPGQYHLILTQACALVISQDCRNVWNQQYAWLWDVTASLLFVTSTV